MENTSYGNVVTVDTLDAADFLGESHEPGHSANPLPEDQRVLCGNPFDDFSDAEPGTSSPADLPSSDGVGHLGGDRPWNGDAPTESEVFERGARLRLWVDDSVLATETVTLQTGETRTVQLGNDLPNPAEVAIVRNGQKNLYARVRRWIGDTGERR